MAYIGSSPTKVVSRQSANIFTYTAVANQVAFTGSDANGNTLACTPSDLMVHMNGLRLEKSDYVATTTTVTLGSGAAAGDEVTITAFVTFETADAYTKSASDARYVNTAGDTMSGDLTVDTNTFHVDVADNRVGIGTSTPDMGKLQINEDAAASTAIFIRNRHNVAGTHSDITFGYGEASNSYGAGIRFRQVDTTHGGQIELYTDNASGAYTKQMQITENGHVTTPNQPMFHAWNSTNDTFQTSDAKHNFNSTRINVGSHFDTSNYRFVAPIAGYYFFTWGGTIASGGAGDAYVTAYLRKNGNSSGIGMRTRFHITTSSTVYEGMAGAEVQYMAANDYMEVWHYSQNGSAYSISNEYIFTGYLIG